jgi:hypothetical protein
MGWLRRILLLVGIAAVGLLAFNTAGRNAAASDSRASAASQSDCTRASVRSALVAFLKAYNQGDLERLDSLFAERPAFQWYSANGPGERIGSSARERNTLIGYFQARHRRGDLLSLASFQFNGNWGNYGNFGMVLKRSVSNFRQGQWFRLEAKGAAECVGRSALFIVMSLGEPKPQGAKALARS